VVLGTKVSQHPDFAGLGGANVAAAAAASLARLGTDYIDLYYAHFDDASTPLEETVAAFDELLVAGKIRAVGVSNYTADRVAEWFAIAERNGFTPPVALQPNYNLVERSNYENTLAPIVAEKGLGVVPYYGLASGFLTGKYRSAADFSKSPRGGGMAKYLDNGGLDLLAALDGVAAAHDAPLATVALAWLRGRPGVVAPIASARTVEQLPDLMASATLELGADEVARLDDVSSRMSA
jgi:aryl-alcohol dehydrogenase-like predicted oxidoreductase